MQLNMGVYLGYSDSLQQVIRERPNIASEVLTQLKAAAVNTVWVTNGPLDLAALKAFMQAAKDADIKVNLGRGDFYTRDDKGNPDTCVSIIESLWAALGPDLQPNAFVLADEPLNSAWQHLEQVAAACKQRGIPTCITAVTPFFAPNRYDTSSLTTLALDYYPFRAAGLATNPPQGGAAYAAFIEWMTKARGFASVRGCKPAAIVQGFQEYDGPSVEDENGLVTLLPGTRQALRPPTPDEVKWQVNAAVAIGHKEVHAFAYGLGHVWIPSASKPASTNSMLGPAVTSPTPTGAGVTLVAFPSYKTTPQMQALTDAYEKLSSVSGLVASFTLPAPAELQAWASPGDVARVHAVGSKHYLTVVGDPSVAPRSMLVTLPGAKMCKAITPNTTNGLMFFTKALITLKPAELSVWQIN